MPAAATVSPGHGRLILAKPVMEVRGKLALPVNIPAGAGQLTVRVWDRFGDYLATPVDEAKPSASERTIEWMTGGKTGHFIVRATIDGVSESSIVRIT